MKQILYPLPETWGAHLERAKDNNEQIFERVKQILESVRLNGNIAIEELTSQIDGVVMDSFEVNQEEISAAQSLVSPTLKEAIKVAKNNIEVFHFAQQHQEVRVSTMEGIECYQRSKAIHRVGLYIPGGSAPLFSTVLMLSIPAVVAGCKEIILCTPPDKNGSVAPEILYTASLCGVTKIYKVGGAMAIGAMAYGTQTIAKVDKIFGPGNRYVTVAKQLVSLFDVAIDMPAGPSEVMIAADDSADSEFVASDMLSQAEHGGDSQSILVTTSKKLADKVEKEVARQLSLLSRKEIAEKALENSKIIVLKDDTELLKMVNAYAAEHLIVAMQEAEEFADKVESAGSIFIGNYTPESAGDYASGTNHTLPTSGWARSMSGVNLDSFTKKITYQKITALGLQNIGNTIETMAHGEGLMAHANAVTIRLNKIRNGY